MNTRSPTLAEVAKRHKRPPSAAALPPLILMTDSWRLPDPLPALHHLPPGSAVIVRETDPARRRARLAALAVIAERSAFSDVLTSQARDAAAKNLVEEVDVDVAELLL